jgi:hypothetical protein
MEMLSFTVKLVGRLSIGCLSYDWIIMKGEYFLQLRHLGIHIIQHMNEMNVKCANCIINETSDKTTKFEGDFQLCERRLWSNNNTLPSETPIYVYTEDTRFLNKNSTSDFKINASMISQSIYFHAIWH